ncbi:hypothetical protein ABIB38_001461 [Massilia sp. UYP11]|uniref:hypothetical protein n=1 Tax=Massilia sp. UYP11 TaxID=1756385 RepID=UPI003D1C4AEA
MPLTPGHRRVIGVLLALAVVVVAYEAAAQRGAGRVGGAAVSRSGSVHAHRGAYSGSYHASSRVSRTSVNGYAGVNRNVNVNRNINVDVDHDYYRPGAALAVAGAAAVTAAAIGSVAYSIPPSCVTVVRAGATYQQCGSTWYQPQYAGTSMTYVVVEPPG